MEPNNPTQSSPNPNPPSQFSENDTKLSFHHVLGSHQNPPQGPRILHIANDDQTIIYQAGHHIALYNYENRTHKFVLKAPRIEKIFTFAVSKNGKFIALSEQVGGGTSTSSSNGASSSSTPDFQLSVYSFRTATRIRSLELKEKSPVISMEFSSDSRHLIAATQEPDQSLYLFHLEKHRLIAHAKSRLPIRQVSMNPHAWYQIATTGPDICNVWRFAEKELQAMEPVLNTEGEDAVGTPATTTTPRTPHRISTLPPPYTYTAHTWFDDEKLLVATHEGKILVIVGTEIKRIIGDTVDTQIHPNSAAIYSILTVERGFVCAGEHGFFSVFERTYDQRFFSQYKKFQTVERKNIFSMCASKKEENIILACENNEMLYFNLANVDILKLEENNFTLLPVGFHGDVCTGVDTCLQKALVCSVSQDCTLRIWNFVKREVEFHKQFPESIYSVALHPQGMMLLVGFRYKLCLYNILHDDLYKCCEWFFKSCRVVKFSHGGHLFAAASTTSVLIINSYTFKTVANLRGHTGMVRDLHWSRDDRFLSTAGFEGALYEWDIYEQEKPRIQDCIEKQATFQACAYDDETHVLCGIGGTDGKVYCFTEDELRRVPVGVQLTALCLSRESRTLFVGTIDGRLLLYNWPVDDVHFREYQVHSKPVTHLTLSEDERFLFSVGADGSLFMLDIEAVVDSRTIHKKEFAHLDKFEDLTVVMRTSLLDHEHKLRSIKERMLQVKSEADRRVQQILEEKNTTVEQQRRDFSKQIERLKDTVAKLKHNLKEKETAAKSQKQQLEHKHLRAAEEIDRLYKEALSNERKKFQNMVQKKDEIISTYLDKIAGLQKEFETERDHMKQRFATDKMNQIRSFNELGQQYEEVTRTFKETMDQTSEDHRQQLDDMQHALNDQELRERKSQRQARTKEALAKTEVDSMRALISEHQEQIATLSAENEHAKRTIEVSKEERLALEEEIDSARETITLHEKTITDLKKQSKELEKLRFILSFKLNKMKQDANPKENMILEMREKLTAMEKELMQSQKQREKLNQNLVSQKERFDSLQKIVNKTQRQLEQKKREQRSLLEEVNELASSRADSKSITRKLSRLLNGFDKTGSGSTASPAAASAEKKQLSEFERQRDYMQQQIIDMKRALSKKEVHMKKDVNRKTGENSLLVAEINNLRREAYEYKQKITTLEQKLRAAQQESSSSAMGETTSFGASSRPSTRGSSSTGRRRASFGLSRVRTPDSVFSSKPNSRKSHRSVGRRPKSGRIVKGSTWSKDSLDRRELQDVLSQMDKTQTAYHQQQQELSQLQEYVANITRNMEGDAAGRPTSRGSPRESSIPTPPRIHTPRK